MALTAHQKEQILKTFVEVDLDIIAEVVYFDGWTSYEECGGFLIFMGIDGTYQKVDYGYSVMAADNSNPFLPNDISESDAAAEIEKMQRYLRDEHDWPEY